MTTDPTEQTPDPYDGVRPMENATPGYRPGR